MDFLGVSLLVEKRLFEPSEFTGSNHCGGPEVIQTPERTHGGRPEDLGAVRAKKDLNMKMGGAFVI